MLSKIQQTAKHSLIIAFSRVSSKLVGFILLPIYTSKIPVSDYGVLGILEIIEILGVHIFSIGLHQGLFRWYSLSNSEREKRNIFTTVTLFLLLIAIMSFGIAFLFKKEMSILIFSTYQYQDFLLYTLAAIHFTNIAKIAQTLLRIKENTVAYSISFIVQFILSLVFNIYFIVVLNMGVEGILLAKVLSTGFIVLLFIPYFIPKLSFNLNKKLLAEMLAFSSPFIITAIGVTILNLGDRYLLMKFTSLKEVGLYSLGYKYSNFLKIFVVDAFALSLPIIGWKISTNDEEAKQYFSLIFTYFSFILIWLGLFVTSFSKGVIHLLALNKEYWDSYQVVPFLVLGIIFAGMQQIFNFVLQIPKKTGVISIIVLITAVFNISFNFLFIPHWGMVAAAIIAFSSKLLGVIMGYLNVKKYYPVRFDIKRVLILLITGVSLFLFTGLFDQLKFWERIWIKLVIIFSFPIILYFLKFFKKNELNVFRYYLKKITLSNKKLF